MSYSGHCENCDSWLPALVSSVAGRAVCANCPEKLQSAGDIEINDTLAAFSGRETQISFVSLFCFFANYIFWSATLHREHLVPT